MLLNQGKKSRPIRVIVDGIVYGFQKYGGINTYFNEILPLLSKRHDAVVDILLPRRCEGRLPSPLYNAINYVA